MSKVQKIEVNEDDFKKVVLMMKYSKEFVKLDPKDLFLGNLWRIAPKLADKLAKKAGYVFVENKGRKTLKLLSEVETPEVNTEDAETSKVDLGKSDESNIPKDEKPVEDTPKSETGSEEPEEKVKVPRFRKRKRI